MVNRNRLIAIASVVLIAFILLIAMAVYHYTNSIGKVSVKISVAPADSTLSIDGNRVAGSTVLVKPGEHTLVASRQDFVTATYKFNTENTTEIPVSLVADNASGQAYITSHRSDFLNVGQIGSSQYDTNSTDLANNYPIVSQLPLDISPEYKIDYDASKKYPNNPSRIALIISANTAITRRAALQAIYTLGYDPSDYEIIFQPLDASNQ